MKITIESITVPSKRRALRDVATLAQSIAEIGLLNAITVTPDYTLIAGYHRLEACKSLGWSEIEATICELDGLRAELAEIDENLARNELNALERSEQLARRKGIYEALHPETKHGALGGGKSGIGTRVRTEDDTMSFSVNTAQQTGQSPRTIQRAVQVAESIPEDLRDQLRETPVADSQKDLMAIARMKNEGERQAIVHRISEGRATTVTEAKGQLFAERVQQQQQAIDAGEIILPSGVYEVLVVDPPWPYGTNYNAEGRRAANPYPEMSLDEIGSIELPAAESCVLWLWTTHKFMRHSFTLLDKWGFRDVAILTWVKDRMGLGQWLRSQSEFCIMAVKGNPVIHLTNQTTIIQGPMREHSRKPDEFYSMVNALCIGRKLDYFSREKREGWDQVGNETLKFVA
jgi:N6-adenosine-specific RNA methylase IME4